jgi:hypothetical protein
MVSKKSELLTTFNKDTRELAIFYALHQVCVKLKGPYYFHEEFVPIECFVDVAYMRDYKINQILE